MEPPSVRALAIAAASAAVLNVAPGQRDRAIEEATKAAISKHQREASDAAAAQSGSQTRPTSSYEAPEWGGCPIGIPLSLEVLRDGTVLETRPMGDTEGKGHYSFGRSPDSDFILEHPSASRFHAVLQFNASTHEAFLYDLGSTHGTFLNKRQIKPHVYVPLAVGSTFKLGQSSRIYVFNGPQELMPEEGLNRAQKKQLAQFEHARMMMEKDKRTAQAQMAAAIGGGGDGSVSWGMGEDAVDPSSFNLDDVDWRSYANSGSLNDRQRKLADKVRAKEYSIQNMRTEIERIQAKEKLEAGLTPGQASTIARNETAIAKMTDEIADLEDMLNESVRQALRDKAKDLKGDAAEEGGGKGKRKRHKGMNDEDLRYLEASDDEDEFFDRTRGHKVKSGAERGGQGGKEAFVEVVSAASLYGEREALIDEKARIQGLMAAAAIEAGQESNEAKADVTAPAGGGGEEKDALDEYLLNLKEDVHEERVKGLKRDLDEIEARLERVKKLLKIADPDGWMSSQSTTVAAAKSLAVKALQKCKKTEAPAVASSADVPFVEEMEEEEEEEEEEEMKGQEVAHVVIPSVDPAHRGGLMIRKPQKGLAAKEATKQEVARPSNPKAAEQAKQLMAEISSQPAQPRGASNCKHPPALGANRKALVADMAADAKVNEYLELMERREREMKALDEEEDVWVPPSHKHHD